MLVLTRKAGESIVIAEQIIVTVLEVNSKGVRIGIEAPKEIAVHRQEIQNKIDGAKDGS